MAIWIKVIKFIPSPDRVQILIQIHDHVAENRWDGRVRERRELVRESAMEVFANTSQ